MISLLFTFGGAAAEVSGAAVCQRDATRSVSHLQVDNMFYPERSQEQEDAGSAISLLVSLLGVP